MSQQNRIFFFVFRAGFRQIKAREEKVNSERKRVRSGAIAEEKKRKVNEKEILYI